MGEEGQGAVAFHSTPAGPPARNCNKSTIGKAKQTFFSKRRGRGKGKGHLNEYARRVCHPTPLPWLAILVKYLCFSSAFLCVSPGEGGEEEEEQKRCKKHRQGSVTTFFLPRSVSFPRKKKKRGRPTKKKRLPAREPRKFQAKSQNCHSYRILHAASCIETGRCTVEGC